ncbi:nuclear transport factor 2 family protein [Algibacillus agarilyticus]|uniref:nuclear transport factor 2 family protein n=1 Tax=Algibacillus agarilyticus TaxID=2234133 RepID=UPI000DD0538A|nr:nuclear transport factor 2 family protein [Algibacillus agarilyticus]
MLNKQTFRLIQFLAITLCLNACMFLPKKKDPILASNQQIEMMIKEYLTQYALREDFDRFMNFYASDAVLEDIVSGDVKKGKAEIRAFLNWPDEKYEQSPSLSTLVTETIIVHNKQAAVKGYFMPFTYDEVVLGPWHFTMWFTVNDEYKITRHVDFINYTPKALFLSSPNSNEKIKIPNYLFVPNSKD